MNRHDSSGAPRRPLRIRSGHRLPSRSCWTLPAALAPIQRLPHVDGLEPDRLAVLLYLSGEEQGGTAFFRQRATGFETVDAFLFA